MRLHSGGGGKDGLKFQVFVYANHAIRAADMLSVCGSPIMCMGGCVSWLSRTQTCVTMSTSEAAYVAMTDVVMEILVLRQV